MKKKDIIAKGLKEVKVKGLEKPLMSTLLYKQKIGQLTVLQNVTNKPEAIKALRSAIDQANNEVEKDKVKIEGKLPELGFTSAVSIVNYTYQLDPDIRDIVEGLTENDNQIKQLNQAVNYLMDNYIYVS